MCCRARASPPGSPTATRPKPSRRLIDENTKAVFSETIGNPAGNVCDIEALAKVAHRHGVPLVVDNTVATPILLKPFDYGADISVHSLTKFLGGHGTTLGGAIVDSGNFPWPDNARRFPTFNEPDESYHGLVYTRQFGKSAYIQRARSVYQRTMGSVLSPFNAFLLLQGSKPWRCEWSGMSRTPARSPTSCATIPASTGSIIPASPTVPITSWSRNTSTATRPRCSPSASRAG